MARSATQVAIPNTADAFCAVPRCIWRYVSHDSIRRYVLPVPARIAPRPKTSLSLAGPATSPHDPLTAPHHALSQHADDGAPCVAGASTGDAPPRGAPTGPDGPTAASVPPREEVSRPAGLVRTTYAVTYLRG